MIKITNVWTNSFNEFVDDIINNITGVTMVIIDCLNEIDYYDRAFNKNQMDMLLNITHQYNVPVKILTGNLTKKIDIIKFSQVEILYWPTFWFVRTYRLWRGRESIDYNLSKGIDITNENVCKNFELTHPYVCLNNIRKYHRSRVMDMLAKYDLIKYGAISWRDVCRAGVIDNHPYKYWKPKILILDFDLNDVFNQETMPNEFNHALMQLVTESDDTETFFSEKTATPIFLNKPFLVASNCGFHKDLKKQGFELYDELFDYSFDDEPDMEIRYDKLVQNLKPYIGLSPTELKEHYNRVASKITHNRNLAVKYAFEVPKEIMNLHLLVEEKVQDYTGPLNNIKYINGGYT
jgi:hypothetical protein